MSAPEGPRRVCGVVLKFIYGISHRDCAPIGFGNLLDLVRLVALKPRKALRMGLKLAALTIWNDVDFETAE